MSQHRATGKSPITGKPVQAHGAAIPEARIADIVVTDNNQMRALVLDDGRVLRGVTKGGMELHPDGKQMRLRIEIVLPNATVNGRPPLEAFKKAEVERPRILGADGQPFASRPLSR